MLANELHDIAVTAKAARLDSQAKSFIIFVLETAKKEALVGRFCFIIPLNTIVIWNEEEMRAAFPSIEEDGFKIQISNIEKSHSTQIVDSFSYLSAPPPKELKVSW